MPTISRFFGMAIRMFYNDHPPAHFHVVYGGRRVLIAIENSTVLHGSLPPGALRLVRDWAANHREELMDDWRRARERRQLQSIPGADIE